MPKIRNSKDVEKDFSKFWESERSVQLKKIAKAEKIPLANFKQLIGDYLYKQKLPREQDIADLMPEPPRIMERAGIIKRIKKAIENIVDIFEW